MSNTEIEYKYSVDNLDKFRVILEKLKANLKAKHHGKDIYYIVPDNPEGRKYLRLRDKDGDYELSFSYAESELVTHEWETSLGDLKTAQEIFEKLKFELDVVVEKKREIYVFENTEVALDEVKDLGKFVEIESDTEENLQRVASLLYLSEKERVKGMGYPDMIRGGFRNENKD